MLVSYSLDCSVHALGFINRPIVSSSPTTATNPRIGVSCSWGCALNKRADIRAGRVGSGNSHHYRLPPLCQYTLVTITTSHRLDFITMAQQPLKLSSYNELRSWARLEPQLEENVKTLSSRE